MSVIILSICGNRLVNVCQWFTDLFTSAVMTVFVVHAGLVLHSYHLGVYVYKLEWDILYAVPEHAGSDAGVTLFILLLWTGCDWSPWNCIFSRRDFGIDFIFGRVTRLWVATPWCGIRAAVEFWVAWRWWSFSWSSLPRIKSVALPHFSPLSGGLGGQYVLDAGKFWHGYSSLYPSGPGMAFGNL